MRVSCVPEALIKYVAESESIRLGACRTLLELGVKLRESVELGCRPWRRGAGPASVLGCGTCTTADR
jgi:hypothetical protein